MSLLPKINPRLVRTYQPYESERMHELTGRQLASFQARASAFFIDMVLAIALVVLLIVLLPSLVSALKPVLPSAAALRVQQMLSGKVNLKFEFEGYGLIYFVLFFGLSLYFGNGRTLGKRLLGIRVVSLVHHRMSLWHCIERALGYAASTAEFTFGFWQYFIHPNRRTVHDRMAETIVIQERLRAPASEVDLRRSRAWRLAFLACAIVAALGLYYFRRPAGEFLKAHHVKVKAGLPRE